METLAQSIAGLAGTASCLYTSRRILTFAALLRDATALRKSISDPRGVRIALTGLGPVEFIKSILAYDGIAESLLLIPASLGDNEKLDLMYNAGCTHRLGIGEENPVSLGVTPNESACFGPTHWLLATSGTTGKPKLIEHTFASLTRTLKRDLRRGSEYHWGLLYDPNRFAGLQVVLQALLAGSCLTLPEGQTFQEQVETLLCHPVNALSATPSLWRKLLMDGRIAGLSLRQITLGGEIADQKTIDVLRQLYPEARVTHIYASTEAGTGFAVNDGLAGFPVSWLEGHGPIPMRVNRHDHLLVKPPVLPGGPAVRARLTDDGYLDTEDMVSVVGQRVLFLGRASGAINVGGNKVNPEQVEQIVRGVPGVSDVRIYAKKSSLVGQLVAADIVAADNEEPTILRKRIIDHCRGQLASWQIPAMLRFVTELPINAAGKLTR